MKPLYICVSFAVGALVGSAATCTFFKKKYEEIANDEIRSTEEVFQRKIDSLTSEIEEKKEYEKKASAYYTYSEKEKGDEDTVKENRPYVITPDEFEDSDYDLVSLIYYDDGVLTDENDNVIKNVDELVGLDSLTQFGKYEKDRVCVRNDKRKVDYEILSDSKKYSDIYC